MNDIPKYLSQLNEMPIQNKSPLFNLIITNFSFYYVTQQNIDKLNINSQKNESKIILIDKYNDTYCNLLVICFHQTLLIISISELYMIYPFFDNNKDSIIYILSNRINIEIFNKIQLQKINIEPTDIFHEQIIIMGRYFNISNKELRKFCNKIQKCLLGYLIKDGLNKSKIDRIKNCERILSSKIKKTKFNQENYITLNVLGNGTAFVYLLYYIPTKSFYSLKRIQDQYDQESRKLISREEKNYKRIHHPFICQYMGPTIYDKNYCLVLEYINGKTLHNIYTSHIKLEIKDKMKIIFQILIIFDYLHKNNFIYRDLKPDNIMIDMDSKTVTLIDFDRMILKDEKYEDNKATQDLGSDFLAPELKKEYNYNSASFSSLVDIYSIGLMIFYIILEKIPNIQYTKKDNLLIYHERFPEELSKLKELFEKCVQFDPTKRPNIIEVINFFYINCYSKIFTEIIESDTIQNITTIHDNEFMPYWIYLSENDNPYSIYKLGKIYYKGEILPKNYKKSMHYFLMALEKKYLKAAYYLGVIFLKGFDVQVNISSAIYYLQIANNSKALFCLGDIFQYSFLNINKSIQYYTHAAEQNNFKAWNNLAVIYLNNYKQDIDKAMYYLTLSANNNNGKAQINLGNIYLLGERVKKNINKAIYYYLHAVNFCKEESDISIAYYGLGLCYSDDENPNQSIDKMIHYFELASEKKLPDASFNLGYLFYKGKCVRKDIKKAIDYFSLISDNNTESQYYLGNIFYKAKNGQNDINLAIHYYTLAAQKNHVKSHFMLGDIYESLNNDSMAIKYLTYPANCGIISAQLNLGLLLLNIDIDKAIIYLEMAAQEKHEKALFVLGVIYYENKYVKRDMNKSIKYLNLSAKLNYFKAQNLLGKIYIEGNNGIPRDIDRSIYYYELAVEQNDPDSMDALAHIYFYVKNDVKKGIFYFQNAANNNNKDAINHLGVFYLEGIYFEKNIQKAITLFKKAAAQNYPESLYNLGYIHFMEFYGCFDIEKAIYYFTLASKHNYINSQFYLGIIYYYDEFGYKNINKAIYYFDLAAKESFEACFALGFIYSAGIDVKKNIEKSISYYKKASNSYDQYSKNNLGIIFKNGFDTSVNIQLALEYFKEAINQKNDKIAMYNMAHIYFYQNIFDKSIPLLIKSSNQNFYPSKTLLAMTLVSKIKSISYKDVNDLLKNDNMAHEIYNIILKNRLKDRYYFNQQYFKLKEEDYTYNLFKNPIHSYILKYNNVKNEKLKKELTNDFYIGFEQ